MKIVSWNCKVGFNRKKAEYINKYNADIYIIQECTKKDIEQLKDFKKYSTWYGDNIDSIYGVGYFSDNYQCKLLPEHNNAFRYVVPYEISGENEHFTIFSIWTKDKDIDNKKIEYTEQVWKAINYDAYKQYLNNSALLIGDFNSNNYWHKQYIAKKVPSQSDIIKKLSELNIVSVYHEYYKCINGKEEDPTLLWQMSEVQRFHIDYCFASLDFNIKNIEIGTINEWRKTKYSDHCPLIIELELDKSEMAKLKNVFEYEFKNWNIVLPKENIEKRKQGFIQQSGWLIQFCFGSENGREYMDYYSHNRMTDDDHMRIYEDGEKKDLINFKIGYLIDKDNPEQTKINENEYYEYNRLVSEELLKKGFGKFTMNMALKAGIDKNL